MFFSYRKIDSYNAKLRIILGGRGIGKTFGALKKAINSFKFNEKRFIYVVENLEMIKTLSQNLGEKFFANLIEYYKNSSIKKDIEVYNSFFKINTSEVTENDILNKIQGGTIKINGTTAGYIVAFNDFSNIKRNNFSQVKYIIIDEFISEKIDIRTQSNAKKIVSIIQSICRLNDCIIYMLANTIRKNDNILKLLNIDNLKVGEFRLIKDSFGILGVAQYVDQNEYKEYNSKLERSVSGRIATLFKQDYLDKNIFNDTLPQNLLLPTKLSSSNYFFCIHNDNNSVRFNITKDNNFLYCVNDYGKNLSKRFCFEKKYIQPNINYAPLYKDLLLKKYKNEKIFFDTQITFEIFKDICGLT